MGNELTDGQREVCEALGLEFALNYAISALLAADNKAALMLQTMLNESVPKMADDTEAARAIRHRVSRLLNTWLRPLQAQQD